MTVIYLKGVFMAHNEKRSFWQKNFFENIWSPFHIVNKSFALDGKGIGAMAFSKAFMTEKEEDGRQKYLIDHLSKKEQRLSFRQAAKNLPDKLKFLNPLRWLYFGATVLKHACFSACELGQKNDLHLSTSTGVGIAKAFFGLMFWPVEIPFLAAVKASEALAVAANKIKSWVTNAKNQPADIEMLDLARAKNAKLSVTATPIPTPTPTPQPQQKKEISFLIRAANSITNFISTNFNLFGKKSATPKKSDVDRTLEIVEDNLLKSAHALSKLSKPADIKRLTEKMTEDKNLREALAKHKAQYAHVITELKQKIAQPSTAASANKNDKVKVENATVDPPRPRMGR
jgi:hypothetical protein